MAQSDLPLNVANAEQALQLVFDEQRRGNLKEAIAKCQQARQRWPDDIDLLHMKAVLLHQSGDSAAAVDLLQEATVKAPSNPQLYNSAGNILMSIGRDEQAVDAFSKAIALDPNFPEAHANVGTLLLDQGNPKAIDHLRRACTLRPQFPEALTTLGTALTTRGEMGEAFAMLEAAVRARPNYSRAYDALASAYRAIGEIPSAMESLREAIRFSPDAVEYHTHWLLNLHYLPMDPKEMFDAHVQWAKRFADPLTPTSIEFPNPREVDRRIRIGYVSGDFRRHSVAFFLEPILQSHDKTKFEIYCYSTTRTQDQMTARLRGYADTWRNIQALKPLEAAKQIRADQIDILVDLGGHTQGPSIQMFASKPAPIAVTYLGYPATTGMRQMDYRITDSIADPPGTEAFYTEKLIRLDPCFLCYQPPADVSGVRPPPSVQAGHVTFGTFNNFAKSSDQSLQLWARILNAIPDARLLLKARGLSDPAAAQHIRQRLAKLGMPGDRVEMTSHIQSPAAHFDQYHRLDIALDTFPYNGATTTCDALWMGVPVVTLAGSMHASRVGASVLSCVGLSDFVARTDEQYVQLAVALANDAERLSNLRSSMRQRLKSSPLLDGAGFTLRLQDAYRTMWRNWCATSAK